MNDLQRLNELTERLTEIPDSDPPPIPAEWRTRREHERPVEPDAVPARKEVQR